MGQFTWQAAQTWRRVCLRSSRFVISEEFRTSRSRLCSEGRAGSRSRLATVLPELHTSGSAAGGQGRPGWLTSPLWWLQKGLAAPLTATCGAGGELPPPRRMLSLLLAPQDEEQAVVLRVRHVRNFRCHLQEAPRLCRGGGEFPGRGLAPSGKMFFWGGFTEVSQSVSLELQGKGSRTALTPRGGGRTWVSPCGTGVYNAQTSAARLITIKIIN